jgi:hypothetical protein
MKRRTHVFKTIPMALLLVLALTGVLWAGEADVVDVGVTHQGNGQYRFDVTVRHADEGWDHYADRWEVLGPDHKVLGTQILYHPHVDEQPFTRSLSGVRIGDTVESVRVRAHDSVHGFGGREVQVPLPR